MIEAFEQIMELWWGDAPFNVKGEFFSFTTQKTHLHEIG